MDASGWTALLSGVAALIGAMGTVLVAVVATLTATVALVRALRAVARELRDGRDHQPPAGHDTAPRPDEPDVSTSPGLGSPEDNPEDYGDLLFEPTFLD
jgi:hypothetical protein